MAMAMAGVQLSSFGYLCVGKHKTNTNNFVINRNRNRNRNYNNICRPIALRNQSNPGDLTI